MTSPLDQAVAAFAVELTQWRVERGMSKKQLATEMGFDPSYVSHVEGRRHRPTEDFAKRAEAVLRTGGALWSRFAEYDELRQGSRAMPVLIQPDQWLPPGTGLVVASEQAELSYRTGVFHCVVRRELYNAGPDPVTRYPVRISVDRYPGQPERSNRYYRDHPLVWSELAFTAVWESGEPMTWRMMHDRDSVKELWLVFANDRARFPLYQGQRATIEYRYQVSEAKWGPWFQRAIRLPTWQLAVRLDLPAARRPVVWGVQSSLTAEAAPLGTPIQQRTERDRAIYEWTTRHPPLHGRYRLEWRYRDDDQISNQAGGGLDPVPRPAQPASARMAEAGIVQRGADLLRQPARRLELPAQRQVAEDVIARLARAMERIRALHSFRKGVGLAAGQIGIGWAVAMIRPPDGGQPVVLINPQVVGESTDGDERYEGCLSFFDVRGLVRRPLRLEVEHTLLDGRVERTVFTQAMARLVGHEVDHLDGRLYTDRMSNQSPLVPVEQYGDTGRPWLY